LRREFQEVFIFVIDHVRGTGDDLVDHRRDDPGHNHVGHDRRSA
jgi:hypothetical protein